ncbi:retrovirus-related pol polyprotein from transposon TNT 1-94 [Tanacetum coccineum]
MEQARSLFSLFCLKPTTKFSCVVRVVATLPDPLENFRSSSCGTYRNRLTLDDPTARIHAYLNAEDAEKATSDNKRLRWTTVVEVKRTPRETKAPINSMQKAESKIVILLLLLMMMMLNEPFRKALESVLVELANSLSSSSPALAEHVEKMKAVYLSQMPASIASPSVNTKSSTVKNSKIPVSNTEAGSSSLKKKDKHRKGTEGVKFRDVQTPPKGVDLSVPYSRYEPLQNPFNATKGVGEGPSGTNKMTTDGVEKKKEEVGSGSLNEPLLRHAAPTSGSPLVEHMNQMRQYCQDRMAAQAAQTAQVEFKKVATDSGRCNNAETSNVVANNGKGKKVVSDLDQQFTSLDQVDPMLDDIKIKARCISLWHCHSAGKPQDPYRLDMALQDEQSNHIQATIRKDDMHRSTTVTRIEMFDENLFGFMIETFVDILTRQYLEMDFIDVPAVHNALFGTRIFINRDIPGIMSFRKRYIVYTKSMDGALMPVNVATRLQSLQKIVLLHPLQLRTRVPGCAKGANAYEIINKQGQNYNDYFPDDPNVMRKQQKELRSETYERLAKVACTLKGGGIVHGKKFILPSSFTGSPRYMLQNYLDARHSASFMFCTPLSFRSVDYLIVIFAYGLKQATNGERNTYHFPGVHRQQIHVTHSKKGKNTSCMAEEHKKCEAYCNLKSQVVNEGSGQNDFNQSRHVQQSDEETTSNRKLAKNMADKKNVKMYLLRLNRWPETTKTKSIVFRLLCISYIFGRRIVIHVVDKICEQVNRLRDKELCLRIDGFRVDTIAPNNGGIDINNGMNDTTVIPLPGASHHMTGILEDLSNLKEIVQWPVELPDGNIAMAKKEGDVCFDNGFVLRNVFYVPGLTCNLLSVPQLLDEENCIVQFAPNICVIQNLTSRTVIGAGERRDGGLFYFREMPPTRAFKTTTTLPFDLWHKRLGHPSLEVLKLLPRVNQNKNDKELSQSCDACHRVKQSREKFPVSDNKVASIFEAIEKEREPVTYYEAIKDKRWRSAMDSELEALEQNKTWTIEKLPPHKKALGLAGVDYSETFAPVAKMVTVRVFLAITAAKQWELHQMDVHNTFLHGDLEEEVFMKLPPGLHLGKHAKFDLGNLKYFLGIEVACAKEEIFLCERKYALDIISEVGLPGDKPTKILMEQKHHLGLAQGHLFEDLGQYRSPQIEHWEAAIRVVRYLKGSPGQGSINLEEVCRNKKKSHIILDQMACRFGSGQWEKNYYISSIAGANNGSSLCAHVKRNLVFSTILPTASPSTSVYGSCVILLNILADADILQVVPLDEDEENQCMRLLSFCKRHGLIYVENKPYLVGGFCQHDTVANINKNLMLDAEIFFV